ncbi:class I SAM-dependent methyltransferase [Rhodopseudomonas palustris]|uniref:Methyltransferase type 12 domain-containing protein n=1 Tax=Rhodopseudomonas palustris (strain BisB18) TaxID=316056 RepID=Q217Q0_RHOPB
MSIEAPQGLRAPLGLTPAIHQQDFIFDFVQRAITPEKEAFEYYFGSGRKSANNLRAVLEADTTIDPDCRFSLLEFASGYGCVTRHLPTELPNAEITACDIHQEAMDFISREMKIDTALSQTKPSLFNIGRQFDVVFALSFFSHMPDRTFGPWLEELFRHVKPGGFLIFTTHGETSMRNEGVQSVATKDGFWFGANSEQKDLDTAEYGTTFSLPIYVTRQIYRRLKAPITVLRTAFWWEQQDAYVVAMPEDANWELFPKDFDGELYLRLHPDVKEASVDPRVHYLTHGRGEGRHYR